MNALHGWIPHAKLGSESNSRHSPDMLHKDNAAVDYTSLTMQSLQDSRKDGFRLRAWSRTYFWLWSFFEMQAMRIGSSDTQNLINPEMHSKRRPLSSPSQCVPNWEVTTGPAPVESHMESRCWHSCTSRAHPGCCWPAVCVFLLLCIISSQLPTVCCSVLLLGL